MYLRFTCTCAHNLLWFTADMTTVVSEAGWVFRSNYWIWGHQNSRIGGMLALERWTIDRDQMEKLGGCTSHGGNA